jgi:hypothetical protein
MKCHLNVDVIIQKRTELGHKVLGTRPRDVLKALFSTTPRNKCPKPIPTAIVFMEHVQRAWTIAQPFYMFSTLTGMSLNRHTYGLLRGYGWVTPVWIFHAVPVASASHGITA